MGETVAAESGLNPEGLESRQMRELVGTLSTDFRQSFKFSQKNRGVQEVLFALLRDYYMTQPAAAPLLPVALTKVDEFVERFTVPHASHVPIPEEEAREEFRLRFDEFSRRVTSPPPEPLTGLTEEVIALLSQSHEFALSQGHTECLRFFYRRVAKNEAEKYLADNSPGRPKILPGGDPHKSYLREYVLAGADTHSNAFNAIFEEARSMIVAAHPVEEIERLAAAWEAHHPGASYYPQNYMDELAAYRPPLPQQ